MCLSTVYRGKEKKEALNKLPDVITVWKVVRKYSHSGNYYTDCKGFPVHAGKVTFRQNVIKDYWGDISSYRGGGHFFLHYKDADYWNHTSFIGRKIVKCRIKKEDIVNIGEQQKDGVLLNVVVVKKATFPKYIGGKDK